MSSKPTTFVCSTCRLTHTGLPMAYRLAFPVEGYVDAEVTFQRDGELVRAGDDRFILANIELPVKGRPREQFVWTCWISLSHESFDRMQQLWDQPDRSDQAPAFGYVSNALPTYDPPTFALKSRVHTRDIGLRPWVELEPTEHPLPVEQRRGIADERIAAAASLLRRPCLAERATEKCSDRLRYLTQKYRPLKLGELRRDSAARLLRRPRPLPCRGYQDFGGRGERKS